MGIIKKLTISLIASLFCLGIIMFALTKVAEADITLWYLDGTTLRPVDSSWSIDIGSTTVTADSNWIISGTSLNATDTVNTILAGTSTTLYVDMLNNRLGVGTSTLTNLFTVGTTSDAMFTITTEGNVGIGTTEPGANLDIQKTTGEAISRVGDDGTKTFRFLWDNTVDRGVIDSYYLDVHHDFRVGPGTTFQASGNVGIGTSTPSAILHAYTFATTTAIFEQVGPTDEILIAKNATGTVLTLDNAGNLTLDTDTFYVDTANNAVAIGTTTAVGVFSVGTTSDSMLYLTTEGNLVVLGSVTGGNISTASTSAWDIAEGIVTASSTNFQIAFNWVTASSAEWSSAIDTEADPVFVASSTDYVPWSSASTSKWDIAEGIVTASSTGWEQNVNNFTASSSNWETAYNWIVASSTEWEGAGAETDPVFVASSTDYVPWASASTSAWDIAEGIITLKVSIASTSLWDATYANTLNVTVASSSKWDIAEGIVTASSSDWNTAFNTINASSSNWDTAYTWLVASSTAWEQTYNNFTASSSNWETSYNWLVASSTNWEQTWNNFTASSSSEWVSWSSASTSNWNMAHGSANETSTIPFVEISPSAGDEMFFRVPHGITIDRINCLIDPADSGDQMDFEVYEADANGDSTSTVDAVITCANTNTTDDGSLTNPSIDAGDYLVVHLSTATGTVTTISISVDYKTAILP